jgi:hypothetical protein
MEDGTPAERMNGSQDLESRWRTPDSQDSRSSTCSDQEGLALPNFQDRIRVDLRDLSIEFGMNGSPDSGKLAEKLSHMAANDFAILCNQEPEERIFTDTYV